MQVIIRESALAQIDTEVAFTGGYPLAVVRAYRGRLQVLRAAPQEEAIQPLKSLRLRLHQNGQHVMRVTDDWDLIVGFEASGDDRVAVVEAMVQNNNKEGALP